MGAPEQPSHLIYNNIPAIECKKQQPKKIKNVM